MPGEWSTWHQIGELCDELDCGSAHAQRAATHGRTVRGFEVERREMHRTASGRVRWEYRFRYVGGEKTAAK